MIDDSEITELNEIPEGWTLLPFSEAFEINPQRQIKRGSLIKFVSMADLKELNKRIQGHEIREYSGGSRFQNNDTLMARITPCLENGKTAFVDILDNNEIAAGSTEFMVLSAKEGKTIDQFVYYLAISPQVREMAIKSMTGTSGRQRVETDIFKKITKEFPGIQEQRKIAKILSDLDAKIELNLQMNKTLERISQAIFKQWFVDFEFPNDYNKPYKSSGGKMIQSELGIIPDKWRVDQFGKLAKLQPGFAFKSTDFTTEGYKIIKIRNIQNGIVDSTQSDYVSNKIYQSVDQKFHLISGDIIIAMTGAEIGKIGVVPRTNETMLLNQRVGKLVSDYYLWSYLMLKGVEIQSLIQGISSASSAQPNISNNDIEKTEMIIPDIKVLQKFSKIGDVLYERIVSNLGENKVLSQIRDSFLPKLMSGRIRVQL